MLYRDPDTVLIHIVLDLWWFQLLDFNFISPTRFYGRGVGHFFLFDDQAMRIFVVLMWMGVRQNLPLDQGSERSTGARS